MRRASMRLCCVVSIAETQSCRRSMSCRPRNIAAGMKGRVVESGAPETFFTQPRTDRARQFLMRYATAPDPANRFAWSAT